MSKFPLTERLDNIGRGPSRVFLRLPRGRGLLTLILIAAFLWSLTAVDWGPRLVHPGGAATIYEFGRSIFSPNFSKEIILTALKAGWRTVAYAMAGMTWAIALSVPMGIFASGVLARRRGFRFVSVALFRGILGFLRAIHELVWAWLFVAAVGFTPWAGILALALPYAGILGRIFAEKLNDVPEAPLNALRSAGATELMVLCYGRLPVVIPQMLSYALYRFECAIRSATIMSFVGLGGLGFQIQLSLADLRFDEVWTYLLVLILIVSAVDWWSTVIRRGISS